MSGPFAGVRVVDFTRFVSGAYTTMTLAALGADVVKVERLPDGDPYRVTGATTEHRSPLFDSLNSGKRSLSVDLDDDQDRDLLGHLIDDADVFVENARPGSLARIGLDPETLTRRNPRLVYASISAFGQHGPSAHRGGFDLIVQAESGVMSVTGATSSGPVKVGVPLLDIGAGLSCVTAIGAALYERRATGRGALVSASLFEFAVAGFTTQADAIRREGAEPTLLGSHSPSFAPYGAFQCADRPIVFAGAGSEALWNKLCDVVSAPELVDDPRFSTNARRLEHRDELTVELESRLAAGSAEDWLEALESAGVPAGEVRTAGEVLDSPQAAALGIAYELGSAEDACWNIAIPFRLGERPTTSDRAAPRLGQHNDEVRRELNNRGYES